MSWQSTVKVFLAQSQVMPWCLTFCRWDWLRNSRAYVSLGRSFSRIVWWVICWSQYWGCWREGKTSKVIGLILWTCVELPLVHGLPQNYAGNNFQRNWKEKILDPKFYHCLISKVNLVWNARDTTYFFLNLSQWESYAGSYGVTITFTPHQTPPNPATPKDL